MEVFSRHSAPVPLQESCRNTVSSQQLQASRALLQAADRKLGAAETPASAGRVEESELTVVRVEESRTLVQPREAGVGVDSSDESTTLRGDLRTPAGTHTFVRCLCTWTHTHTHTRPPGTWAWCLGWAVCWKPL